MRPRFARPGPSPQTLAIVLVVGALAIGVASILTPSARLVFLTGLIAATLGVVLGRVWERRDWVRPVRSMSRSLVAFNIEPDQTWDLTGPPRLSDVIRPILELQTRYRELRGRSEFRDEETSLSDSGEMSVIGPLDARMTRSGTYEPPAGVAIDAGASAEFPTLEMISRLDPRTFRWLDSTETEQRFLGWRLEELKVKSFFEIVQEDDRELARQQLQAALARGEGHGMVYRIATARGEPRAVELNVGVRYGPDGRILHLRCHLTDVTAKLRDETEIRRRTQELIQANNQLRRTNRELRELKDRYSDLYQNAPAMYLTVELGGTIQECNQTMLTTLGHPRAGLINQPSARLSPGGSTVTLIDRLNQALHEGPIEFGDEWVKADGESLFVWITGSAVFGSDSKVRHYRCVAQDITARRALEAALQIKHERLATANRELSSKNKELDEFTYVVSHDLQEPLRTLIAFSDFLMRDHGDRLDDSGREYVRYLVEASRRLRSLIQDLLTLSRAGKVTGEFATVNLGEVVEVIRADFAELVRSRNARVEIEGPLPEVWGDRDRVGQLLANLVGNALKYNTSEVPTVTIQARLDDSGAWVTVSVSDNGIGIDPRYHDRIFQLFRRLHTREEYAGTGAGLSIAQKIVQAHGGRIWVESLEGMGSTFHVTLPSPPESSLTPRARIAHAP